MPFKDKSTSALTETKKPPISDICPLVQGLQTPHVSNDLKILV